VKEMKAEVAQELRLARENAAEGQILLQRSAVSSN